MRKPVAHGDHFNEQKIEAGGIEEGGEGVGGVVWGEGGFEGHLGWWNQGRLAGDVYVGGKESFLVGMAVFKTPCDFTCELSVGNGFCGKWWLDDRDGVLRARRIAIATDTHLQ